MVSSRVEFPIGITNMHRTPCLTSFSSTGILHEHNPGMLQLRLLTGWKEDILRPYILAS